MKAKLSRLKELKGQRPITMLTAYDFTMARLVDAAGVDAVLVGDSLGNVIQGRETTLPVTLSDMIYHGRAVRRAVSEALLIIDMPFMSYHVSKEQGLASCGRVLQETEADAVKLEGGPELVPLIQACTAAGIPVVGHLGLQPQHVRLSGYTLQGKAEPAAEKLLNDALALEQAGIQMLVLELTAAAVAAKLTRQLKVPTIGIGSGPDTDGQVLVLHDMLGLTENAAKLHHNRIFENLGESLTNAVLAYRKAVENRSFPPDQTRG